MSTILTGLDGADVWVMTCRTFVLNRERAVDYLNMLERIYVFDGYAGWDPEVCPSTLGTCGMCCAQPTLVT